MGQTQPTIQFLALGDWGCDTDHLKRNGKEMAKIIEKHEAVDRLFVIALGDNFYVDGVKSVDDPKWTEYFSKPFEGVKCPWYPILGEMQFF